jgi:hypothetical protein
MNITLVGIIVVLVVVLLLARSTIFAKPTGTYETTIINKREQQTVIYTGVFIPMKRFILETTELHQLNVKKRDYDRINVGDKVMVTRYSNGQHKLQG